MAMEMEYLEGLDHFVLGCDEVGRGPLAGPVVTASACVDFHQCGGECPEDIWEFLASSGIHDSKKLSSKKRRKIIAAFSQDLSQLKVNHNYLLAEQNGWRLWLRLTQLEPLEIDRLNILRASLEGMKRSTMGLLQSVSRESSEFQWRGSALVDGSRGFELPQRERTIRVSPVVKGDQKSLVIGLASIFAKEYRDYLMENYGKQYPGYGFEEHAGYPTAKHRDAIRELGPCAIHRKSFKGVREFCHS